MKSEVDRRLKARNVVASDDRGGENTPTVTSLESYWLKTKISMQETIHRIVVCVKIKRVEEGSQKRYVHPKKATATLSQNFGAVKHFVPRSSEGESDFKSYTDI